MGVIFVLDMLSQLGESGEGPASVLFVHMLRGFTLSPHPKWSLMMTLLSEGAWVDVVDGQTGGA